MSFACLFYVFRVFFVVFWVCFCYPRPVVSESVAAPGPTRREPGPGLFDL